MQKKIYFNDKTLIISDEENKTVLNDDSQKDVFHFTFSGSDTIKEAITAIEKPEIAGGTIYHPFINEVFDAFKETVTFIQAAGGLVKNNEDILMIFRRGKWDLPKGKLDEDENLTQAAVREVKEETGIGGLTIKELLTITYHTYYQNEEFILKETHWYLMETMDKNLTPQTEEDILECLWVNKNDLSI